jgi:hypothetical protein
MFDVIMLSAVKGKQGRVKKGEEVECFGNFKRVKGRKKRRTKAMTMNDF